MSPLGRNTRPQNLTPRGSTSSGQRNEQLCSNSAARQKSVPTVCPRHVCPNKVLRRVCDDCLTLHVSMCAGPYSHFRVGATILTFSDTSIPGANFENAAFPSGTCAERVALGTGIASSGCKPGDFKAVGVTTDQKDDGSGKGCCSPCGQCRQALREFCSVSICLAALAQC